MSFFYLYFFPLCTKPKTISFKNSIIIIVLLLLSGFPLGFITNDEEDTHKK